MTGELYAVLLQHSILGRLAAPAGAGVAPHPVAFADGVATGLASDDLTHAIFGARTPLPAWASSRRPTSATGSRAC